MGKFKFILIGAVLIIIDQGIKSWVLKHPSFVIRNDGIIFGLGKQFDYIILLLVLFLAAVIYFIKEKENGRQLAISLLLAGAISNLVDRVFYGSVIDYLQIRLGFSLVFNLADLFLIAGFTIFVWKTYKCKKN